VEDENSNLFHPERSNFNYLTVQLMGFAPLDNYSYIEKANRGQGLSWIFDLDPNSYISDVGRYRFRLEILR